MNPPPRSWLFVPADSEKKIAKAIEGDADAIIFDLEDSVAPDRKAEARKIIEHLPERSGGPARYVRIVETGGRLGFITPLTHNFCDTCNRVRLTCTGTLFMCLGQDSAVDLREPLRASPEDDLLNAAIDRAMAAKPKAHDFLLPVRGAQPAVARHMSMTGG